MAYLSVRTDTARAALRCALAGRWTIATLAALEGEIAAAPWAGAREVLLDGAALTDFDTAAAGVLDDLCRRLREGGGKVSLSGFRDTHRRIFERISALPREQEEAPRAAAPAAVAALTGLGRQLADLWRDGLRGTAFLGEFLVGLGGRLFRPRRLRLQSVLFHVNEVGIKAAPIISLMAFSIAFVTGYQGAFQLQKFDATIYTVDLVVLSILREMGVLIAAIMVAGRSGSAFAAQLGTMKLNEEVDALATMGVSPFEVLVLPRLLGILIALPLLTVIADMMGLLGGYIFSSSYLGYSYVQFASRMQEVADMRQFWVGVSKAPVFALLIGIVGCMQGLQAGGSAEDVGRKTITAVVQSIFLVIVADAIFSVIFTRLGI